MPRRPRVHEKGAFYHVMARGNRKQRVFNNVDDYRVYIGLMRKYSNRYAVEVHGYALMPNHVHMLLRVNEIPLFKFMQGLQQTYTQYFNKTYEQVGHVFQGRYKCIYVGRDEYLLELIRYIHLNPVKDGLVDDPIKYRWTSHDAYFNNRVNTWVQTYFIKSLLAEYGGTIIDDYQLVPEAIPKREGTEGEEKNTSLDEKMTSKVNYRMGLDDLANKVSSALGFSPDVFFSKGRTREIAFAKRIFSYIACRQSGYRMQDVADFMGCTVVNISKSLRWVEEEGVRLKLVDNNLLNRILE